MANAIDRNKRGAGARGKAKRDPLGDAVRAVYEDYAAEPIAPESAALADELAHALEGPTLAKAPAQTAKEDEPA